MTLAVLPVLLATPVGVVGVTIPKSSPSPSQTHTESVHLAQQKTHGKAKK
jgi:hypothetical protein